MDISTEEPVSTFQSVAEAEKWNSGPQQPPTLKTIYTNIWKVFEGQPKSVDVEARAEACGENPPEKGVIQTWKKVYMPPLAPTYKET